jgi:tetratricopeptide (TPR) repeat protein
MNTAAEPGNARQPRTALPFPGLRPFSKRDHDYFFGRETQKYALYLLLTRNHFISVVGSSGSGKSSIVRAGLLPMLEDENAGTAGKVWQYTTMRPGRDPIERLARALAKASMEETDPLFGARRDRLAAVLRASRDGISEALAQTAPEATAQFVLVVDQFEELFRYLSAGAQANRIETAKRREEATNFVQLLLAATRSYDSRIRVLITMRSDFIGDCANFHGLPEVVSAAQFLVPSLSRDQREEAIREPIKRSGATIESELVERLLNDSNEELDQLPVLQHCLARLWMRAGSSEAVGAASAATDSLPVRHLTELDYKNIGGLAGALSGHADEILDSLPGKERTVEHIFRALTEIDKDGRATRRPRELAQLIAEAGGDRNEVCAVLDEFRADDCSFIVPPLSLAPTAELPDGTVIDVGHEALLRRWKRVSGDPEATGERADKRDIGWLRKEQKDGERYQFLRSCIDSESPNEARLSDDQVKRYWAWWDSSKPNPAWAARYGGRFEEVDRLIKESDSARRRSRKMKAGALAAAVIVAAAIPILLIVWWQQQQEIESTYKLAITSADKFSAKVLETFNDGQVTTAGALTLQQVATAIYPKVGQKETSDIEALRTNWLLTDSDLDEALGEKDRMRASAKEVESYARRYLASEPDNRRWQELLYEGLYRLGDLDLDPSTPQYDSKRALAEYDESRRIADKLLSRDVAQLQTGSKFEVASIDFLAKQRFDLAFAIDKVGEAMQVRGDFEGSLAQFSKALELATMIESATRMDYKLQSATTRIKIANLLLAKRPPDLDGALRSFSEAIQREEAIFATDRTNNILRSNLAAAYEGRAQTYQQSKDFDLAFKGYIDAADLLSRLVDDDPRDSRWLEKLARVRLKFGAALEAYARSQNLPLDKAVEQYKREVATREKLVEKDPADPALQRHLQESRNRLQRVLAAAVP